MRVVFLTSYDSTDIRNWSGLGYYMAKSLEKQGIHLIRVNCHVPLSWTQRVSRKLHKLCFKTILKPERDHSYLRKMAAKAMMQLKKQPYDVIFAAGSLPVSFLQSEKPIIFCSDATYDGLIQLYVDHNQLSKRSILQGHAAERIAIQKASLILYTSQWAASNAIQAYSADENKIAQVSFGPNLFSYTTEDEILRMIQRRLAKSTKNFLLIGVDWHRKGADIAIDTVARLNQMGIAATITIVGCPVPEGVTLPSFVTHYAFISKSTESGMNMLRSFFQNADFFLLPTRADCTPVVFSEAASYGLPIITTDVGGCRSAVLDQATGFCLPHENFAQAAAERIAVLCEDNASYERFCVQAFKHYKREMNWDVFGKKAAAALQQVLQKRETSLTTV